MANSTPARHWINGEWVAGGPVRASIDPATSRVIGTYHDGGHEGAAMAIEAARQAFARSTWRSDKQFRADVIERMAAKFDEYAERLIALLSLENGKVTPEATFEVRLCAPKLRCGAARRWPARCWATPRCRDRAARRNPETVATDDALLGGGRP